MRLRWSKADGDDGWRAPRSKPAHIRGQSAKVASGEVLARPTALNARNHLVAVLGTAGSRFGWTENQDLLVNHEHLGAQACVTGPFLGSTGATLNTPPQQALRSDQLQSLGARIWPAPIMTWIEEISSIRRGHKTCGAAKDTKTAGEARKRG